VADFRLETGRLILRDWRQTDRVPFAEMNADPEVMRYFPATQSREQSDAAADRICSHFAAHGFGLFALEEKDSGAFIGFTGFQTVAIECPVQGDLEIGWRLARPYWRHGLAFEAASACLAWLWREQAVARVVSMTAAINAPSIALMERLGMTYKPRRDFAHPAIDRHSPINRHVVYVKERPQ
jgi:ribosomal-protein-alanine N-acetyltransferase